MVANRMDLEGKIIAEVRDLPDEALAEVVQFLEYQRYKVEQQDKPYDTPYRPVALGGLFREFDLSEEEIAEARQEMWGNFGDRDF
ncbi:MAG: hypothetical protein ACRDJW_21650 [Thermomicrobiales bacterium]